MHSNSIRQATKDDISDLQILLTQTGLFPAELLPDMMAPALAGETSAFWLTCLHDGRAMGLCYTEPEEFAEGTWNMRALAVRLDLQGQGFGSALVADAETRLRLQRQRVLIVETSGTDGFALTRSFYAQNGYDEEARIRDFWSPGDDKVIFRKPL